MEPLAWVGFIILVAFGLAALVRCIRNAPVVNEDHCPAPSLLLAFRHGRLECGGPCTDDRPLPCQGPRR